VVVVAVWRRRCAVVAEHSARAVSCSSSLLVVALVAEQQ
jgi:hypothetical protein